MSKSHPADDISHAEILDAINNGFTRMQEQMDRRFAIVDQRFATSDAKHEQFREETAVNFAAVIRKLDSVIERTDTHERILERRSAT